MQQVEIRVKGQIDQCWSEWLDGLAITHTTEGETVLVGSVVDQAALYGLIARLRDLGLPLVSLNPSETNAESPQIANTDSG
jgi:hypothetical protein